MKIKRVSDVIVRNFKMRICHISDTHGGFPKLYGKYDVVLHTGDFFPNSAALMGGNKIKEAAFQLEWLRQNISNMKPWLQNHMFLFVGGNHDFLNADLMAQELNSAGIKAINLTDRITTFQEVNFYGFPYIPFISGMWNYEREIPEMQEEVDKMVAALNTTYVDVLACHGPPYKILDLSGGNQLLGSTTISEMLAYKLNKDFIPATYLCGHIHEAHGLTMKNGVLFSNAATSRHILEIF